MGVTTFFEEKFPRDHCILCANYMLTNAKILTKCNVADNIYDAIWVRACMEMYTSNQKFVHAPHTQAYPTIIASRLHSRNKNN